MANERLSMIPSNMAANSNNNKSSSSDWITRLQTAILLVTIISISLYYSPITLALGFSIIAIDEYYKAQKLLLAKVKLITVDNTVNNNDNRVIYPRAQIVYILINSCIMVSATQGLPVLLSVSLAWLFAIVTYNINRNSRIISSTSTNNLPLIYSFLQLVFTLLGFIWISFLWSHSILLFFYDKSGSHADYSATQYIIYAIFVTVMGENGALIGGRSCKKLFGTHSLSQAISPNKSIEGFLAQIIVSALASVIYLNYWATVSFQGLLCNSLEIYAGVGLIVGTVAAVGDLFESYLKRSIGTKDLGSLLPGTGGILDRIDGLLFAFPAIYYIRLFFEALHNRRT
jgi:CDP-diglyceride synthetase